MTKTKRKIEESLKLVDVVAEIIDARIPVIFVTTAKTADTAIEAMKQGAFDYLHKPLDLGQLQRVVDEALDVARRMRSPVRLANTASAELENDADGALFGSDPRMLEIYKAIGRVAAQDLTVLITGESGTGKELVARAIYQHSARAQAPFFALNCAAIPEHLLESELFGHEKGAFTDAKVAKPGLFVAARGGTIFLDEIGELPLEVQPKLLRALQEHRVRPVGATSEVAFDARLICATNRNLESMIEAHAFREDLYFRINVLSVELPPLRSRGGDILVLASHFLARISARAGKRIVGFSPEAAQKLMAYAWPGNVRELENCIERGVALASFDHIAVSDLPEKIRAFQPAQIVLLTDDPSTLVTLDELERRYVARVLEGVGGNKAAAARVLGIERKTLYRMLERWGDRPPGDDP